MTKCHATKTAVGSVAVRHVHVKNYKLTLLSCGKNIQHLMMHCVEINLLRYK